MHPASCDSVRGLRWLPGTEPLLGGPEAGAGVLERASAPEGWTLADKCALAGGSEGHSQDPSSELWLPWVTCPSAHPSLASRPHAYCFPESPPT